MMRTKIDKKLLRDIVSHNRKLGFKNRLKGLNYERCAELPFIAGHLQNSFGDKLEYLDIGSGESPFPSYLLKNTNWDITCIDKFSWVQKQHVHVTRVMPDADIKERFHVVEKDFLAAELPGESYDVITNISVIEHFEGDADSAAMAASARLLRRGGFYILTTLINEGYFKEFYLNKSIYGESYRDKPVFYQRHYDLANLDERIIRPSGLVEVKRVYFGDYGFQAFENIFQKMPKLVRAFYQWAMPAVAARFLTYSDVPVSRKDMMMNTASGVISIMTRE